MTSTGNFKNDENVKTWSKKVSEPGVIIKKITPRDEEIWQVAELKSNIEICSKPSDLFAKLDEKRRIRHEKLLEDLAQCLQDINSKTEKNITISSIEVKTHMKHYDNELKEILKSLDKPEIEFYSGSVFLSFENKANEYRLQQQKLVDEFYDDLVKFEDERAKENEKLFHITCEEIRKIGYFLPYQVQAFVEHETLKMNQMSLHNRRCYGDLKLTLTLLTEQAFKSFMDKIFCIQEKWVQYKIQEAYFIMQDNANKTIAKLVPEAYTRLELKGQELVVGLSPDELYSTCKTTEWSKNVTEVVNTIEMYGKNLIDLYRKTMESVLKCFNKEVEEIKNELSSVKTLELEERVIKPIVFEAQFDQDKEVERLEFFWQEALIEIKENLKDVTDFLMDAGKLWDRHSERLCESKKLILKALEKAYENNQPILQEFEIKLNMALDVLRQEHIKAKLDKAYEAVIIILDSIKEKYESMYLEDVSTIEDYYKMVILEADVLASELKEFLHTHPKDVSENAFLTSNQCNLELEEKLICKQIQTCAENIKAVRSWKIRVWSVLEGFSENTRTFLEPLAECWVKKKIEHLAEKMSVQLELLQKRFLRVEVDIYDKRAWEIEYHQTVFDGHKEGVKIAFKNMKKELALITRNEANVLAEIKASLREIETSAKVENRAGVIRGNQTTLKRKQEELENKLKSVYVKFRADSEAKMADMKQANIEFMKAIKLFHEGGNYSAEEGKTFIGLLEAVDREISTEFKNIIKDVTKDENNLVKRCSDILTPPISLLTMLHEETFFNHLIGERIRNFTAEIRQLAGVVKSDFEFLKKQSDCLFDFVYDQKEPLKDDDFQFWFQLLTCLYKNVSNLFYPIKFPVTPAPSIESEEEPTPMEGEEEKISPCFGFTKFSTKVTISRSPTVRSAQTEDDFTCKDFKLRLFKGEPPPENDGTFMAVVSNFLWMEMNSIQKTACTFYKKIQGRQIIRKDLIPLNYDAFAEEILLKFQFYNAQCERLWLETIMDFLSTMGTIKKAANWYLQRKLEEYERKAMKALKTYEEDFLSCLEARSTAISNEFEALDSKLLPLYGYPQNKELLKALEEEVVQRTAGFGIQWDADIKKFKNQLNCFRVNHIKSRTEVKKIEVNCFKLKDKIFVDDLGKNLFDAVMEYVDRGGFCTARNINDNAASDVKSSEKEESSKRGIDDCDFDHEMMNQKLESIQAYLKQLKEIIEIERFDALDSLQEECPPCPDDSDELLTSTDVGPCSTLCRPKLGVLLNSFDTENCVKEIFRRISENLRKMRALADSKVNVHEETLFNWLNVWKFNVKKIQKLYSVRYEAKEEIPEVVLPPIGKTDEAGDFNLQSKHTVMTPKPKSRSLEGRPYSNECKKRPDSKTNLFKSKLTEIKNSEHVTIFPASPRNYHGLIPILRRRSLNTLGMSSPIPRSPSPLKKASPKELKSSKIKTIKLDEDEKRTSSTVCPRSPSPVKRQTGSYKKTKARTSSPIRSSLRTAEKTVSTKPRTESAALQTSPRKNSPTKRKSKVKVYSSLNVSTVEAKRNATQRLTAEPESLILKQSSQPSLCQTEKIIQPLEKVSLDHIKNEVQAGDLQRLSFKKVHLRIEKSVENLSLEESKRSFMVTYSSEDIQKNEEISLSFLQNLSTTSMTTFTTLDEKKHEDQGSDSKSAIRTLSGHELELTPSMKMELEKAEIETESLKISEILHGTVENFDEQKDFSLFQDDANEYDSEMSTDGEISKKEDVVGLASEAHASGSKCNDLHQKSANSLWKTREVELLNDVDYRQSVYHPAVSRRQHDEHNDIEFQSRSKSIEDGFEFSNGIAHNSHSSHLKNRNKSQVFTTDIDSRINDRTWKSNFEKTNSDASYNSMLQDGPLYGMKRIRTKKERISGALLHVTLKIIRLLALFNLWPGDNCYMLTSQSLRFAR